MRGCTLIIALSMVAITQAQNKEISITTEALTNNVHILYGQGGNIGVYEGSEYLIMIDSQFAKLSNAITKAIAAISPKPIKILVNTHYHGDHTGGNSNFASDGASIYAHKNTYKRLQSGGKAEAAALPVLTFAQELSLYVDDSKVLVYNPEAAHTDTDAIVYFLKENVVHTGDVFFNNRYPFVDLNSGGSILGAREAISKLLMMINDDTQVIPGHGKLATKSDLQNTLQMYNESIALVKAEILAGKTEIEVAKNDELTKDLDKAFYTEGAFISPERWRRTVYQSLTSEM